MSQGYAVVLINGNCASFADVIAVTKGLVVLTQCKFYGDSTRFLIDALRMELAKMGYFGPKETTTTQGTTDTGTADATLQDSEEDSSEGEGAPVNETEKKPANTRKNGHGMTERLKEVARAQSESNAFVVFEFITTKQPLSLLSLPSPASPSQCIVRQWDTSAARDSPCHTSPSAIVPVIFPLHPNSEGDEEVDLADLAGERMRGTISHCKRDREA